MPAESDRDTGNWRQRLGRWGENIAAQHLESKGYKIICRNWRSRRGEIDLVAKKGELFAFVEVKTRRGREFGLPEEALTSGKAGRLMELAQQYVNEHDLIDVEWRIDFVAVEIDQSGELVRCEHIPNAVFGW